MCSSSAARLQPTVATDLAISGIDDGTIFTRELFTNQPLPGRTAEGIGLHLIPAARDMVTRFTERGGGSPQTLAADATYGNGELLHWLQERGIAPHIRVKENPLGKGALYGIEKFTYSAERNQFTCPEGKELTYVGINPRNRTHVYMSTRKRCRDCSQKALCTNGSIRQIAIHIHEPARQLARELAATPAFAISQRARKKVEALFAELKNQIGLRRLRLRRMKFVHEQFLLAASAQNLKLLVRFRPRRESRLSRTEFFNTHGCLRE